MVALCAMTRSDRRISMRLIAVLAGTCALALTACSSAVPGHYPGRADIVMKSRAHETWKKVAPRVFPGTVGKYEATALLRAVLWGYEIPQLSVPMALSAVASAADGALSLRR
jgi:hypothetical protein